MHKESHAEFLEEKTIGNVRLRLHCFDTSVGKRFAVDLSAYNDWAHQFKLLFFRGGLTLIEAETMFEQTAAYVAGYDWDSEEFIPQKA